MLEDIPHQDQDQFQAIEQHRARVILHLMKFIGHSRKFRAE